MDLWSDWFGCTITIIGGTTNFRFGGGCEMLIVEREYISADTSIDALRQSPWRLGDKIGNCEVVAITADLIGYQLYRVWPEFRDMKQAAIEFASQPQYVGSW